MEYVRLPEPRGRMVITSFVASRHPSESCGLNGLPLTPNSVAILGRSQILKTFHHPGLCQFLDSLRGQHERVVMVSEHYEDSLYNLSQPSQDKLVSISRSILEALDYLNDKGLAHGNLRLSNICFDLNGSVKLFNFGLGHITRYGDLVAFPIGDPRITAPEVFYFTPEERRDIDKDINSIPEEPLLKYKTNIDVWSLGMILLSKISGGKLWKKLNVSSVMRKVMGFSFYTESRMVLDTIRKDHDIPGLSEPLRSLILLCLDPNPKTRMSPKGLLNSDVFSANKKKSFSVPLDNVSFPSMSLRSSNLSYTGFYGSTLEEQCPIDVLSLKEIYYLWGLAGGDVFSELRKMGLLITRAPILSLPTVVSEEGYALGDPRERSRFYDSSVIPLSTDLLESCLSEMEIEELYPLLNEKDVDRVPNRLPLVIKEEDVKYQCSRILRFRRLLIGYPYTANLLRKEAEIDVLPFHRSYIWASLLGITSDVRSKYAAIDKETPGPTDRQIEVDIPRCHQYNSLLSSPEGHRKFKRILKAWVNTNPQYVYWQGLDSLTAPFLYLNFNDEALAFASLSSFIPKYLNGMFKQDNAAVIQEYLAKFTHIQAFHDSKLFNHLNTIGFIPDLYAIPWVLTMFAHVFPLNDIFHLWDKLLLGSSSFPLCVGLGLLLQLRERLLEAEFNDCILLFSDLPVVDIEKVVEESVELYKQTPSNVVFRKYEDDNNNFEESDLYSISLEEIKNESVPRIDYRQLLTYMNDESKNLLLIDSRTTEEYKVGTLPGSISLPISSFDSSGNIITAPKETIEALKTKKRDLVVVFGSIKQLSDSINTANKLLKLEWNRLVVLHNGIESLKLKNVLIVPNS